MFNVLPYINRSDRDRDLILNRYLMYKQNNKTDLLIIWPSNGFSACPSHVMGKTPLLIEIHNTGLEQLYKCKKYCTKYLIYSYLS